MHAHAPLHRTRHRRSALRRGLLLMLLPLVPLACRGDDGAPTGPNGGGEPAAVAASHAALDFTALGDSTRLTAGVRDAAGNTLEGVAVTWASTDETLVTVDETGRVMAVGWGAETIVTASADQVSGQAAVSVLHQIAFVCALPGKLDICVMNADGSDLVNLTDAEGIDENAAWSPDGSRIVYVSSRNGNGDIYVMDADGSGQAPLAPDPATDSYPSWSPDGAFIVFTSQRDGDGHIHVVNADGSGLLNVSQAAGLTFARSAVWRPRPRP